MNAPKSISNSRSTSLPWSIARYIALAGALVITLIAAFYTVENWRGKRAWENCRRKLEAKGEVLDWAAYIPPPVPDDQNFYKAPNMKEWFTKGSDARFGVALPSHKKGANLLVAEVSVALPGAPTNSGAEEPVLRLDDPVARQQAAKLVSEAIGRCAIGAKQCMLVAQPWSESKVPHWLLQADAIPTAKVVAALFPKDPVSNIATVYSDSSYLQVVPDENNTFRVCLKEPVFGVADYLKWTEPLTDDFDQVRKALERPYARLDGDYEQPFLIAIPSFVNIRNAAQILSQRAQCYLLLGQPEAAWHELSLIHDLSQILLAKPSGKPITLVGAMIDVAVSGLYTAVVQDGLRLHGWREPQLAAIQRQLAATELLTPVVEAFREEWAATHRTFESTSRAELAKLFGFDDARLKFMVTWMPAGWLYQNLVSGSQSRNELLASIDLTNQLIRAYQISEIGGARLLPSQQRWPYTFLAAASQPNYVKAVLSMARNQTVVNQAQIACALELYRLARGQYPETLDPLQPEFVERLPHDPIGARPLKYCHLAGGGYRLYSVGWDEKDDGGILAMSKEEGDWVWEIH